MTGHERRKLRKREQILRAAEHLFKKQGFRKTTVDDVAIEAGVSKVTVYNHFTDKQHLIEESLKTSLHKKIDHYSKILDSDKPWMTRLETVIRDKMRTVREYGGEYLEMLCNELPELIAEIRDHQLKMQNEITFKFLDEGRNLGFVPDTISNEAVAIFIECLARGIDSSKDIHAKLAEKPEIADGLIELITYGMVQNTKDTPHK